MSDNSSAKHYQNSKERLPNKLMSCLSKKQ